MTKKNKNTLFLIHSENCGHCIAMMPEWNSLESKNDTSFNVCKIESSELRTENINALKQKIKNMTDDASVIDTIRAVQGFPSIFVYDCNKKKMNQYQGSRTATEMQKWAKSGGTSSVSGGGGGKKRKTTRLRKINKRATNSKKRKPSFMSMFRF